MNSGRQETTIYRWVILSVTFLAQAAVGAPPAIFVLAVFFQVDLHLNKTQLGLLSSAFGFGIMTSLMISGWITDILGIRRALVAGLSLTGFTILLVALMRSFAQGMLIFFVAGVAAGVGVPAMMKAVFVWFPVRERGSAMAIMRAGVPLMGAVTAVILPSLALNLGWRAAVVVLAGVVAPTALVAHVLYREVSPPEGKGHNTLTNRPVVLWDLFRNHNIWLASFLPAILTAVQFSIATYLVLYLTETLGISVVAAGGALAITQVSAVVGRVFWGTLSDRVFAGFRKQVLALIGAISALLLLILSYLSSGLPPPTVTILAVALGMSVLGWHAVYSVLLPELSGRKLAGSASGFGYTLIQFGGVAGPFLFGYIVNTMGGYRWAWGSFGLLAAASTPLMLLVRERQRG